MAGIDRITILIALYQSTVSNETKYRRLRLSCCNKLLTIFVTGTGYWFGFEYRLILSMFYVLYQDIV